MNVVVGTGHEREKVTGNRGTTPTKAGTADAAGAGVLISRKDPHEGRGNAAEVEHLIMIGRGALSYPLLTTFAERSQQAETRQE